MEDKKRNSMFQSFWLFVAKTVVVLLLLGLFLDLVLPDFSELKADLSEQKAALKERLVKTFNEERTKLYVLSFVQNPAALYKTSEIKEREGKIDSAIRDVELAIGLLEMHSADKQVIKRYYDRLEKLKAAEKKRH